MSADNPISHRGRFIRNTLGWISAGALFLTTCTQKAKVNPEVETCDNKSSAAETIPYSANFLASNSSNLDGEIKSVTGDWTQTELDTFFENRIKPAINCSKYEDDITSNSGVTILEQTLTDTNGDKQPAILVVDTDNDNNVQPIKIHTESGIAVDVIGFVYADSDGGYFAAPGKGDQSETGVLLPIGRWVDGSNSNIITFGFGTETTINNESFFYAPDMDSYLIRMNLSSGVTVYRDPFSGLTTTWQNAKDVPSSVQDFVEVGYKTESIATSTPDITITTTETYTPTPIYQAPTETPFPTETPSYGEQFTPDYLAKFENVQEGTRDVAGETKKVIFGTDIKTKTEQVIGMEINGKMYRVGEHIDAKGNSSYVYASYDIGGRIGVTKNTADIIFNTTPESKFDYSLYISLGKQMGLTPEQAEKWVQDNNGVVNFRIAVTDPNSNDENYPVKFINPPREFDFNKPLEIMAIATQAEYDALPQEIKDNLAFVKYYFDDTGILHGILVWPSIDGHIQVISVNTGIGMTPWVLNPKPEDEKYVKEFIRHANGCGTLNSIDIIGKTSSGSDALRATKLYSDKLYDNKARELFEYTVKSDSSQ